LFKINSLSLTCFTAGRTQQQCPTCCNTWPLADILQTSSKMKTIIWKGIVYNSLEYFKLFRQEEIFVAKSKIIGAYENKIYSVEYSLGIDNGWKIFSFDIECEINNIKGKFNGERKDDIWKINETINPIYTDFDFVDISLTPFTNTLPIRNLNLTGGQEKEIDVIYVNVLDNYIKPVKQKYRKNLDKTYRYENVPNDFEAEISVDELGLVITYPSLFERVSDYQKNAS
jgi:uncharacterized protein